MSTPDPRAWLDEIKARADAATEGPWHHQPWGGQNQNGDYSGGEVFDACGEYLIHDVSDEDGRFIAHARTEHPAMAAALTAVLDLHRKVPIYTDQCDDLDCGRKHTEVWAQEYYHSDNPDGYACEECSDDGDDDLSVTDYPCPTVRAITENLVAGHPDPQPETPTPGRCQRCGDQYGPWDMTWTCEHCLGGDR